MRQKQVLQVFARIEPNETGIARPRIEPNETETGIARIEPNETETGIEPNEQKQVLQE